MADIALLAVLLDFDRIERPRISAGCAMGCHRPRDALRDPLDHRGRRLRRRIVLHVGPMHVASESLGMLLVNRLVARSAHFGWRGSACGKFQEWGRGSSGRRARWRRLSGSHDGADGKDCDAGN